MKIVVWRVRIHRIQLLWPSIASVFFLLIAVLLFSGAMSPHGSVGGTGIVIATGKFVLTGNELIELMERGRLDATGIEALVGVLNGHKNR
jgi:hypothetical protein